MLWIDCFLIKTNAKREDRIFPVALQWFRVILPEFFFSVLNEPQIFDVAVI